MVDLQGGEVIEELNHNVTKVVGVLSDHGSGDLSLQIIKMQEEVGEVAEAYLGTLGSNPRKGATHTPDQLLGEMVDVINTTLVAARVMGFTPEEVLGRAAAQSGAWLKKVFARMAADHA